MDHEPAFEARIINLVYQIELIKRNYEPGATRNHMNLAIVALCNALETLGIDTHINT